MKLQKIPQTANALLPDGTSLRPSPQQEAEYLRYKHLRLVHDDSQLFGQKPMMGFGGEGRKVHLNGGKKYEHLSDDEKDLFWAQMIEPRDNEKRMLKGGHGVPLSGECCR